MLKGITALREGTNMMLRGFNALRGGINTMLEGINALREGFNAMLRGINALRDGINTMLTGGYVPLEGSAENAQHSGSDESSRCCASQLRIQVRMSLRPAARIALRSAPMREKREAGPGNNRGSVIAQLPSLCVALGALPARVNAQAYRGFEATAVSPLVGHRAVSPWNINDLGWVTFHSWPPFGFAIPLVWVNGIAYDLPIPPNHERPQLAGGGMAPTSGVIVGEATSLETSFGDTVAWVPGRGAFVLHRLAGRISCGGKDINDRGIVIGACYTPTTATYWTANRVPTALVSRTYSAATAINKDNVIVGVADTNEGATRAVIWWPEGGVEDIGGVPLDATCEATDINNFNEVTINLRDRGCAIWRQNQLFHLPDVHDCLGRGNANAINDWGWVAGTDRNSQCSTRAAFWPDETIGFDLNELSIRNLPDDVALRDAEDINNGGQILARSDDDLGGNNKSAYILTPYQFELPDPVPGIAGQVNTIQVTGLQPGQKVRLAAGFKPGAQALPNSTCLGGLLLIQSLKGVLPPATADNSGTATFVINVPASLRGQTLRLQAYDGEGCEISHSVDWTF